MFMKTPILLFMNCSASHPATPPMMIAAIQPIPADSMISSHDCCTIEGDDSPGEKQGKLPKTSLFAGGFPRGRR
jgi:hypothetical protein